MNRTKIEWALNPDGSPGYTWNPITGCLNGCSYCYARKLANGRLKKRYLANKHYAPYYTNEPLDVDLTSIIDDPFYPRCWPDRLEEWRPLGGLVCELVYPPKTRKGIFVCNMSDLFGIGIPEEWTRTVLKMIEKWPAHRFYLLTKQPQNLAKFSPFPDNCWVGVTATDEGMFHNACYHLEKVEATVKYLSLEPLLSVREDGFDAERLKAGGIKWLIIGAQTKPTVMPKLGWVKEIVAAADKAGVRVFLKDSLHNLMLANYHLTSEWGWREGRLRQEMPVVTQKATA